MHAKILNKINNEHPLIKHKHSEFTSQRKTFLFPVKLKLYQFHTKVAKHYFCSICGIYTHHNPRSNPSMTGFNLGCVDEVDVFQYDDVPVNDGQNHPLDKN